MDFIWSNVNDNLVILLIGTSGMLLMILGIIGFSYLYQKKISKKNQENKEIQSLLKSEELKSAYALLEGQDRERERVANDLHDRLGGQLSTVTIYLDLLEQSELTGNQKALLEKLQISTQFSINEVRAIAHDLNNSALNYYGFQKAVEQLCSALNEAKNIQIQPHISIHTEIPAKVARSIYHVIQELFTNTLRHANATKVRLEITGMDEEINIIFEDDGIGFNTSEDHFGMGLKSIQLRVDRVNGNLIIDSIEGKGSTFIIEVPLSYE